ncbi:MAG: radical SAM protein [Myxococcota bacterium]
MRSTPELLRDARMWASRRLVRSLAPPDWLSVNLTLRCNLKCVMCTTCYDAPELTTREVLDLVDQACAWGVKVFNPLGGEAFIRHDLEEILAHATRKGMFVTLTTNATLITPPRAARVAAIPPENLHVNVSVDGLEGPHDEVRGKGSFRRALAGYRNLRAADAVAGNSRRWIGANVILHRRNHATFLALLDFLEAEGFDGVQVLNLFRNDADSKVGGMWFEPEDLPALERLVAELERRPIVLNRADDLRLVPRYYREGLRPLEAPCWAGWKELYVNADGKVVMCDGKLDFLAGAFGDVRRQTLRELWRDPELAERRRVVKTCTTPCIQNCYLRRESDGLGPIARGLADNAWRRARPAWFPRTVPGVLTLELSDVPDTPGHPRTTALFARSPVTVEEVLGDPNLLRTRARLDHRRGFMGRDVVRHVLDALAEARIAFETIELGWRGEPLWNPELEGIVELLRGRRARLVTSGRLLDKELPIEVWARENPRGIPGVHVGEPPRATIHPAISWDARLTASVDDVTLQRRVGDVLKEPFAAIWARYEAIS